MDIYVFLQKNKKILIEIIILAIFICCCLPIKAQRHGSSIMVGVGASYPSGVEGGIAFEKETSYHNAWEFSLNYYLKYAKDETAGYITRESFWHNYNIWTIGTVYKPCVSRGRNHHGNLRIGAFGGSDKQHFVGGGTIGYEHTFRLYDNWGVYFLVKEDITAKVEDLFRTGVAIGIKIPLEK